MVLNYKGVISLAFYDDYEICEKIYENGQTLVYKGIEKNKKSPVIIKILNTEYPSQEEIARFKYEYQMNCNVKGDRIINVLGFEKYNNTYAIVQEDFGGVSLTKHSDLNSRNLEETVQIFIETAKALGDIHFGNVIHKDINTENILYNKSTKQLKIIDFGSATKISHENSELIETNVLEGTLFYISPEQTGRINRSVDYRSDYYSMGVMFYKILTGAFPFNSKDPMELIHSHIARKPIPAYKVNPDIPKTVSDIIDKLMSKNAEDRYQSSYGIIYDLEYCAKAIKEKSDFGLFSAGTHDIFDKFNIPKKLYGREKEIEILMGAFNGIAQGNTEMMLVAGYAGIGKSSLVNEIHKPVTEKKGFFISGKFDQFRKNTPYSALIQAFQGLCKQLLTKSEKQLAELKGKIIAELGANGGIVTEVIPELEIIIGQQSAVPVLGPAETQYRFNLVFEKFIKVFADKEHPLVIFFDDLQWADSATLNFIKKLVTEKELKYLMIIGAYRDNEVNLSHPFIITVDEIKKETNISEILLLPLKEKDVMGLVSETLCLKTEEVKSLAGLLWSKTGGNPFFVNAFFTSLYSESLLWFDYKEFLWKWDIKEIEERGITDNVVELMIKKMNKLPENTRKALQLGACIGNTFDLNILAHIYEKSVAKTAEDLWPAVLEGLIIPLGEGHKLLNELGDSYELNLITEIGNTADKFLHDHVQKAAYDLVDINKQKLIHLKIGRLLLKKSSKQELEDLLFYITEQLNQARELIIDDAERISLAELNLKAGKKAKDSTAYGPATVFLNTGIELLEEGRWESSYSLTFELYKECAEAEYLIGNFEKAGKMFNLILEKSSDKIERAEIYKIMMLYFNNINEFKENIRLGIKALEDWGINLPDQNDKEKISEAYSIEVQNYKKLTDKIDVSSLIELPALKDDRIATCLDFLVTMVDAAYLGNPDILGLIILKQVNLSIEFGNSTLSPNGYTWWGVFLIFEGNYEDAYKFGKLALEISDMNTNYFISCRANHMFGGFIRLWKEHIKYSVESLKRAFQFGNDSGDVNYSNYAATIYNRYAFYQGKNLKEVSEEAQVCLHFMEKTKHKGMFELHSTIYYANLSLQGLTENVLLVNKDAETEKELYNQWKEKGMILQLALYSIMKLMLNYMFGNYSEAIKFGREAEGYKSGISPQFDIIQIPFYLGLSLIAQYKNISEENKSEYAEKINECLEQLKNWSEITEDNCLNKYCLLAAEKESIFGIRENAETLYEKAIETAHKNGFLQEEAIANELYAKYWKSLGKEKISKMYMTEAVYLYELWSADAKIKDIEKRYSHSSIKKSNIEGTISATGTKKVSETLDISSILKASNAISQEIVLSELLIKMMKIVLENAGAEKGYFVVPKDGSWFIEAQGAAHEEYYEVLKGIAINENSSSAYLSQTILNYAVRTKSSIVVGDASCDDRFTEDTYIQKEKPKSILCSPIMNKGKLIGLLYLENNLATDVFTPSRVEVLKMLSSELGISIENANLYKNLEEYSQNLELKVFERTKELNIINNELTKKNNEIEESKKIIEDKNRKITDSIRYALRIQNAVLPVENLIKNHFDDMFIVFKPKDIISGDFYWFSNIGGYLFIAVGDCTGHGVPGAFLSMIGNTLLNKIINENKIFKPSEILEKLHMEMKTALRQGITEKKERREQRDGMDICLCRIDKKEGKIVFSGAKRPLYILKNEKLVELNGDRKAIGGRQKKEEIARTSHEISFESGDMVYLCTDGYMDQQNQHDDKYGLIEFEELLINIGNKSCEQQKKILVKEYEEHKKNEQQRDDITIVGLRL